MTRRPINAIRRVSDILLLAGALGVGIWIGSTVAMTVYQRWQNFAFEHNRSAPKHSESPLAPRVRNGDIVGRLTIPRLHVEAMIREGTTSPTLAIALGHIPGTALPGQPGNIGVAGHRDTLFRALRNVEKDDAIAFETQRATYRYRVESTEIVTPEHVEVLKAGAQPEITLVTCYPFDYIGAAPKRFIVKAKLISTSAESMPESMAAKVNPRIQTPPPAPHPPPSREQVTFDVVLGHSRQIVPGKVWFGLDSADASTGTVSGWLWVLPEHRTIWLRDTEARQPVVFDQDGRRHELRITSVANGAARGYVTETPSHG
jgi:sortase A